MFPALIGPEKVDVPIGFSYERSSRVFIAPAGSVAGAIIPEITVYIILFINVP
jgi:hypothetical protein